MLLTRIFAGMPAVVLAPVHTRICNMQSSCCALPLQGDAVMMAATELSSTRIHWDGDLRYLLGVMVGSWFLAAFALGDYR